MSLQLRVLRHRVTLRALVLCASLAWLAQPTSTAADPALQTDEEQRGVSITAFTFEPAEMTISTGESITWVNTDGVPHTSTGSTRLWGGVLTTDESFTYTFDAAGTYPYFCEIHPAMVGTITVVAE
jgi:plastocyanin